MARTDSDATPGASDAALGRLFELTVLLAEAMDRDLTARGLTRARATVLSYLRDGGPMTQRDLAQALRVTPRNVTGLVDALEATGFVARTPHPRDRRATLVGLTQRGDEAATALAVDGRALAAFLFEWLGRDRVADFTATLERLLARLHEPEFADLRRAALERWTVGPARRRRPKRASS